MYKPGDDVKLRKALEVLLQTAFDGILKRPQHMRVLSSVIQHTELQPEGDLFDIHIRVELHPKKEKPAP